MSLQMDSTGQDHVEDDLLDRFVGDELSIEETTRIEHHLSRCQRCANRITAIAADTWGWGEVANGLSPDEFDSASELEESERTEGTQWLQRSRQLEEGIARADFASASLVQASLETMLKREISGWLDPTDDPEKLGRFAGYEIVGIVGHGGMGIVMKGFERSLNRYVAIKVLAPRLATHAAARQRFEREARAAAAVLHDNIIAIHRVDQWHGLPFLVMSYVAGESLQQRVDRQGALSVEATVRIGVQVASGLAAAHARGLVHRDIKPANILLQDGVERVTITDFGLARAADDAAITATGFVTGTPQFMSPEQADARPMDHRSDLFSLGSVLYTMIAGRPPFRGATHTDVIHQIRTESAMDLRDVEESVPAWLACLVDWCHAKDPDDRPRSAGEIEDYLGDWLAHLRQPSRVARPISPDIPRVCARGGNGGNQGRGRSLMMWCFGPLFFILASIVIYIESGKGVIQIRSELDDVPIVIKRGDAVVEKLTVTNHDATVRVAAGQYVVQIDGEFDGIEIEQGSFQLRRGDRSIVQISEIDQPQTTRMSRHRQLGSLGESADPAYPGMSTSLDAGMPLHGMPLQGTPIGAVGPPHIPLSKANQNPEQKGGVAGQLSGLPGIPLGAQGTSQFQTPSSSQGARTLQRAGQYSGFPTAPNQRQEAGLAAVLGKPAHLDPTGNQTSADEFRDSMKKMRGSIEQAKQSVARWRERIELWRKNPSGRVDGEDIPNSDSMQDAEDALAGQLKGLEELQKDDQFIRTKLRLMLASLDHQQVHLQIGVQNAASELERTKKLLDKNLISSSSLRVAEGEYEQRKLALEVWQNYARLYHVVAAEFEMADRDEPSEFDPVLHGEEESDSGDSHVNRY